MTAYKQYDTIIFDLGRVLINVEPERGLFGLLGSSTESINTDLLQRIISDPTIKQHNCGKITSLELYNHFNDILKLNLSFEQFKTRWCDLFSPIPEMEDFVFTLKDKIKLGLLSDTDPLHWQYAKSTFDFLAVFKNPTLSFQVGHCKPEPEMYYAACKMNITAPERCIFVDDLQKNIDGAVKIGMTGVLFTEPAKAISDITALFNC